MLRTSLFVVFLIFTFGSSSPTYAQESKSASNDSSSTKKSKKKKKRGPRLKDGQSVDVRYGSPSWNDDPTKIDSAKILIKDRNSGKMAQILVEETAPDSASFSGAFNVNWGSGKNISPRVYIPPASLRGDKNWISKTNDLIRKKRLSHKPFILKKGENILEVYDTRKQARAAAKAYRAELAAKRALKHKRRVTDKESIAAKAVLEAAQLAALEEAKKKLAIEAAIKASERLRLAQIEKKKKAERLRKQKRLAAREKKRRKEKAAKIIQQALVKYRAKEFSAAEKLFEKALDLDPENRASYFQYGVTLFSNKKYNRSIVIFNDAKNVLDVQRDYYLGLNFYYLKEYDNAIQAFERAKAAKDPNISPGAAFYIGLIKFTLAQYEASKPYFEWVLDHSKDPRLDEQAESYIEQIASILFFAEQSKTKFFLNLTAGLTYDSNVLTNSDSTIDAGTATNVGGARTLAIVGAKYRPVYNKKHEFSVDADWVYYYSFDSVHTSADAMVITLGTPYTHKNVLWGKGYQTTITPAYEKLYLDALSAGTREVIMNSLKLFWTNTLVISDKWFSAANLKIRQDDSLLASSTGTADLDATKITLETSQTLKLGKAKDKVMVLDFNLINNGAKGSDQKYFRFDLGITYIRPAFWETSWSSSFKFYNASYGSHSSNRADSNFTLSTGLSKSLNKTYSIGLTADYTKNSSNVDANAYSKWTMLTTLSAAFSR